MIANARNSTCTGQTNSGSTRSFSCSLRQFPMMSTFIVFLFHFPLYHLAKLWSQSSIRLRRVVTFKELSWPCLSYNSTPELITVVQRGRGVVLLVSLSHMTCRYWRKADLPNIQHHPKSTEWRKCSSKLEKS